MGRLLTHTIFILRYYFIDSGTLHTMLLLLSSPWKTLMEMNDLYFLNPKGIRGVAHSEQVIRSAKQGLDAGTSIFSLIGLIVCVEFSVSQQCTFCFPFVDGTKV